MPMRASHLKDDLRRLRRVARSVVGRDIAPRLNARLPTETIGGQPETGYGAWNVVQGTLNAESVVYSVGIGTDVSFDLDLIHRTGATVYAFDPTPASLTWLAKQTLPPQLVVEGVALAATDGDVTFYPSRAEGFISHSMRQADHTTDEEVLVPARRLSTLMNERSHTHIDLLKLDIEGAEYDVLKDVLDSGLDVRQLLVEFHHRFSTIHPSQTRRAIEALRSEGYAVFSVSPNGEEIGFIRTHPSAYLDR